ncbi:hypothetical protein Zmor_008198 [Zophobas morio]|uniref:Uncharacterized protein n=1 Tax=Zophobas morio TaxID=2755281 RepID=A0AA38IZ60_9CUCU|nr:hypothetical protein Zmor_008198 [Zophobas morio]
MRNQQNSEYIACILFSKYDIFAFLHLVTYKCDHSNSPIFKISKIFLSCNAVLFTIFTFCGITSYTNLPLVRPQQKSFWFLMISDQLVFFNNALLILVLATKTKTQLLEFSSWTRFFEHPQSYNLLRIIHHSDIRKIKIARTVSIILPLTIYFFISVYYVFSYDYLPFSFLRKPFLCMCYVLQTKRVYDLNQTVFLTGILLKNFKTYLVTSLTKNLQRNVEEEFKKCYSFVRHLNTTVYLFMETTKFVLYVWSFIAVVSLILNFFLLIKYNDYSFYIMLVLQIRNGHIICGILSFLFRTQDDVNRTVSFYFLRENVDLSS